MIIVKHLSLLYVCVCYRVHWWWRRLWSRILKVDPGSGSCLTSMEHTSLKLWLNSTLRPHSSSSPQRFFTTQNTNERKNCCAFNDDSNNVCVFPPQTFTTQETITNAESAKEWFLQAAKDVSLLCQSSYESSDFTVCVISHSLHRKLRLPNTLWPSPPTPWVHSHFNITADVWRYSLDSSFCVSA